ncbi:MAG TPA: RNA polymerase sigma factor FliA, partial [Gammaproteobacteria bacterium]|nr:RNA polymerase sigma factor FliA [Gammaproteobacteria bacterium]
MSGAAMYAEAQAFEQNINDEIAQHTPLVKRIAYHLMSRLPPSVQQDDLIQAG